MMLADSVEAHARGLRVVAGGAGVVVGGGARVGVVGASSMMMSDRRQRMTECSKNKTFKTFIHFLKVNLFFLNVTY